MFNKTKLNGNARETHNGNSFSGHHRHCDIDGMNFILLWFVSKFYELKESLN